MSSAFDRSPETAAVAFGFGIVPVLCASENRLKAWVAIGFVNSACATSTECLRHNTTNVITDITGRTTAQELGSVQPHAIGHPQHKQMRQWSDIRFQAG